MRHENPVFTPDHLPDGAPLEEQHIETYEIPPQPTQQPERSPQPQRGESLGSLSLRNEVETDWETVDRLVRKVPLYKLGESGRSASRYGNYVPIVAEAVVSHYDESVSPNLPTADFIKGQSTLLRWTSKAINFFSPRLANKFDNYLVGRAHRSIARATHAITSRLDAISSIEAPQEQFLSEVELLYLRVRDEVNQLPEPEPKEKDERSFAEKLKAVLNAKGPAKPRPKRERRPEPLHELTKRMQAWVSYSPKTAEEIESTNTAQHWFGEKEFPLLTRMLRDPIAVGKLPLGVRAATPEIMEGLQRFLAAHGRQLEGMKQTAHLPLMRFLAQHLTPEKLATAPDRVEHQLTDVYKLLPKDSKKFTEDVLTLSRKITNLARHGVEGRAIARKLFKDIVPY